MAFQRYKLKYCGKYSFMDQSGTGYRYLNNSVLVTLDEENNTRLISIASHGIGSELSYEDKCGLVAYLGIDLDRDVEEYKVEHPFDPTYGDTHYFKQSIDPTKPNF